MPAAQHENAHTIGFGCGAFSMSDGHARDAAADPVTVQAIKAALSRGFRHIDTASMYGTEVEVGLAVADYCRESTLPREKLFISSKVYSELPNVNQALRDSLQRLQLDYLDLYLIHAPFKEGIDWVQVWRDMEQAVEDGLVRSIGVSNFRVSDLQQILQVAKIKPDVNQIEAHPYLQQPELEQFCKDNDIGIQAYSTLMPLTRKTGGPVDSLIKQLADEHDLTPCQVLLQWSVLRGYVPITTSFTPARMSEYLEAVELLKGYRRLSPQQVEAISAAGATAKYRHAWPKYFETLGEQ